MTAYYNEFDPYAAQWLRNLIAAGLIADGVVDQRSITEVEPHDLTDFTQCHFFAGIGGWSAALRLAAWPDDAPVWTGSCPCQPFSAAGKQKGHRDERHLWPVFCDLIRACRPGIVFGEQVASAAVVGTVKGDRPASSGDAPVWFDGVSADLESAGYAVGAAVLGAHSVGAPHIRQRLFWVADSHDDKQRQRRESGDEARTQPEGLLLPGGRGRLGDSIGPRSQRYSRHGDGRDQPGRDNAGPAGSAPATGGTGRLPDSEHTTGSPERLDNSRERTAAGPTDGAVSRDCGGDDERLANSRSEQSGQRHDTSEVGRRSIDTKQTWMGSSDFWRDCRIVSCRDGKARRVGPSTSVLAHGVSRGLVVVCSGEETHSYSRTGALKGLGNAIVPQVAAEFIRAFTG